MRDVPCPSSDPLTDTPCVLLDDRLDHESVGHIGVPRINERTQWGITDADRDRWAAKHDKPRVPLQRGAKTAAVVGALALALTLSGCAGGSGDTTPAEPKRGTAQTPSGGFLEETRITMSDGREVTCVALYVYKGGGLSCDFPNARPR